jgi:hypothetical protein
VIYAGGISLRPIDRPSYIPDINESDKLPVTSGTEPDMRGWHKNKRLQQPQLIDVSSNSKKKRWRERD